MTALLGVAGLLASMLLFTLFVSWERAGKQGRVLWLVLSVVTFEVLSQASSQRVPVGIWRIPVGPLDARPIDVLLPIALLAKGLARPPKLMVSRVSVAWVAFLLWFIVTAYWGYASNQPVADVINQLRGMLVIVGTMLLVGGLTPSSSAVHDLSRRIEPYLFCFVVFVYVVRFSVEDVSPDLLPVVGLSSRGRLHPEAALVLVGIGAFVMLNQLLSGRRSLVGWLASVLAVLSPLLHQQAANIVAMAVVLVSIAVVSYTPSFRKRVHWTGAEAAVLLVTAVVVGISGQLFLGDQLEVVDTVERALFSDSQDRTSAARIGLWSDAIEIVTQSPLLGDGVGAQLQLASPDDFLVTSRVDAHNVLLDVAIRSGLPGLLLLGTALVASFRAGWSAWKRAEGAQAALALWGIVVFLGVLAKGMVESSFDQARQAALFGVALGVVVALDNHMLNRSGSTLDGSTLDVVHEPPLDVSDG